MGTWGGEALHRQQRVSLVATERVQDSKVRSRLSPDRGDDLGLAIQSNSLDSVGLPRFYAHQLVLIFLS